MPDPRQGATIGGEVCFLLSRHGVMFPTRVGKNDRSRSPAGAWLDLDQGGRRGGGA
jgi:hypothetical protein